MRAVLVSLAAIGVFAAGSAASECPHYNATDGKYLSAGEDLSCAFTGRLEFVKPVEGSPEEPCSETVVGASCLPKVSSVESSEVLFYAPSDIDFGNDGVVSWEFRSCYSPASRTGRKWRKFNADPSTKKAHHCTFKFVSGDDAKTSAELNALAAAGEPVAKWEVDALSPDSTQYIIALGKNADGDYTHFASHEGYFQVDAEKGIEPDMVAVAVIMSIFSVAVLVGFFIVEKTFAARKQK